MEMLLVHIDASVSKKKKNPFLRLWCFLFFIPQEKEKLATLERKYADLTGGRGFSLREVGLMPFRLLN